MNQRQINCRNVVGWWMGEIFDSSKLPFCLWWPDDARRVDSEDQETVDSWL